MAKKRQKPDPHFGHFGPEYDIDTSFGGFENKYSGASVPEGIEMLKGDIADLAKKYWESTQKEENQVFKLPPLPTSWATGILRLLTNPGKGTLYEAVKKSPLKVSDFTTLVGGKSRRDLLLNLIGKKKKWTKDQLDYLRRLDDAKLNLGTKLDDFFAKFMKSLDDGTPMPKMPKFKGIEDSAKNILKKAKDKKTTFHAEGGLAGMLGEPRSGYQGGGLGIAKERWDRVKELFDIYKSKGGVKTIEEFGADILFEDRPGELPYFKEGGRIGLAEGDTPSEAWMRDYFYDAGYDDEGVITLYEYMHGPIGKTDYANHGPGKAEGGRIGFRSAGLATLPYLSRGWSQPGVYKAPRGFTGMEEILGGGILGIGASKLLKDDKDKENLPVETEETKLPQQEPPGDPGLLPELAKQTAEEVIREKINADEKEAAKLRKEHKEKYGTSIYDINRSDAINKESEALWKKIQDLDNKIHKNRYLVDDVEIEGKTYKLSDKNRPPTEDEIEDYMEILPHGGEMDWSDFGDTVEALDHAVAEQEAYEKEMFRQYQSGELDKYVKPEVLEEQREFRQKKISEVIEKAFEEIAGGSGFTGTDYKYDAQILADSIAEQLGKGALDELPQTYQTEIYNAAQSAISEQAKIKRDIKNLSKPTKTLENLKKTGIINISDPDVASEFSRFMKESDPEGHKKIEEIVEITNFDPKGRKKNAFGGRIGLDTGGLAGMLGERTGFPQGKRVTKKPKKSKKPKVMTIEEAIEDINKKLKAPDITEDESRRLRIILHDLILGPGMGGPRGDKIYQSEEDLPEGILELLQKDPAFDFEEFSEIEWSPKGLRWTDKGHPGKGARGMAGPMGVWSGMAPFGETAYMDEGRGPRNRNIHMTDLDKAKIINHELRHNLMGDPDSPLHYTQPEWVKEYEGPHYLRSQDNKPIGTSGHELYNRFIDSRLFPGEEHPGPNAPYFDKILRDHWEPNFQKYKKAVKELKSKPEHLSAEGGRIGLGTGGPPITLQRPMFNEGGLTKTVPPERGPDPQGLPSALYNGIMRPRSY